MKTLFFQSDLDRTAEEHIAETSGDRDTITNALMNGDPLLLRVALVEVSGEIPLDEAFIILSGEDEVHDSVKVEVGSHDEIPFLMKDVCW